MTTSPPPRPTVLTRALLRLIRGADAEFLLGDLEESWRDRVAAPGGRFRAEVKQLNDVVRSVARWRGRGHSGREGGTMGGVRRQGTKREGSALAGLPARASTTLQQALRGLRRRPGFAAVTVATLALGIGATTTILSVVDGVMLRPLPFPEQDRLVAVGVTFPGREWTEGVSDHQRLAGVSFFQSHSGQAVLGAPVVGIAGGGGFERISRGVLVTLREKKIALYHKRVSIDFVDTGSLV